MCDDASPGPGPPDSRWGRRPRNCPTARTCHSLGLQLQCCTRQLVPLPLHLADVAGRLERGRVGWGWQRWVGVGGSGGVGAAGGKGSAGGSMSVRHLAKEHLTRIVSSAFSCVPDA